MTVKIKNRFVLLTIALAILGLAGTINTLAHSGPTVAHAQTTNAQTAQDKETNDDSASTVKQPSSSTAIDAPEKNDKPDTATQQDNGADGEIQDGN